MPRVLVAPNTLFSVEGEYRKVLRDIGFDFVEPRKACLMTEDEVIEKLADCDASLAGSEPYTRGVLDAAPKLRVISKVGVGYDKIDVPACTERGIVVCLGPGNADGVAEHTLGLMIALARDFQGQTSAVREGQWPRRSLTPLRGMTLAICGLGRCGKAVAKRARAFDMRIIAYDPIHDDAFAKQYGVELKSFEDIFVEGDFVTVHVPLTDETRGMIGRDQFIKMKKSAVFINTARGPLVNEEDLHDALNDRELAGAGLDVFEQEPPLGSPLMSLSNVILTCHTAGVDLRARDDMALRAAQNIAAIWKGEWPAEFVVNPEVRAKARKS
ncbi:MAG: phosphoglycerate dehydrogenase [Gemmataceae bacterium]